MGFKARPIPDCRTCGACCISPFEQDRFCDVTEADIKRLPKRAQQLVVHGGSAYERFFYTVQGLYGPLTALATKQTAITRGPLKRVEATVCACLSGNPLDRVACDVYEQRPEICRTAVKPGDRTCRVIRRELFALIDDNQSK